METFLKDLKHSLRGLRPGCCQPRPLPALSLTYILCATVDEPDLVAIIDVITDNIKPTTPWNWEDLGRT